MLRRRDVLNRLQGQSVDPTVRRVLMELAEDNAALNKALTEYARNFDSLVNVMTQFDSLLSATMQTVGIDRIQTKALEMAKREKQLSPVEMKAASAGVRVGSEGLDEPIIDDTTDE